MSWVYVYSVKMHELVVYVYSVRMHELDVYVYSMRMHELHVYVYSVRMYELEVYVYSVYFSVLGSAGVLSGARPKTSSGNRKAGIQIFCDENQAPSSLPPQTGQYSVAPKQDVTNKENEKKAGVWTKSRVRQRLH